MKKRKQRRKFGRKTDQRKSLLKSLTREFFLKEKIKTTETKAKELSIFAEKQITRARQIFAEQNLSGQAHPSFSRENLGGQAKKERSLHLKRLLLRDFSPELVKKLVDEIAPRYKTRSGGYTRIIKLGPRQTDGARIAIIELIK